MTRANADGFSAFVSASVVVVNSSFILMNVGLRLRRPGGMGMLRGANAWMG